MDDLITKINKWADERNLKRADPKIQWMRITEEGRRNSRCTLETDQIH